MHFLNLLCQAKCLIRIIVSGSVLTNMQNNLKWPETTYDLKRPTTNKKQPEMTYNEQETTWKDLQWTRNNLKWPTMSQKQPETTFNKEDTTYNDLNLPIKSKKRCKTTNNNQILRLVYSTEQLVLFSNMFSTQHLIIITQTLLHGESWWKQSTKHLYIIVYIYYEI